MTIIRPLHFSWYQLIFHYGSLILAKQTTLNKVESSSYLEQEILVASSTTVTVNIESYPV